MQEEMKKRGHEPVKFLDVKVSTLLQAPSDKPKPKPENAPIEVFIL